MNRKPKVSSGSTAVFRCWRKRPFGGVLPKRRQPARHRSFSWGDATGRNGRPAAPHSILASVCPRTHTSHWHFAGANGRNGSEKPTEKHASTLNHRPGL